MQYHRILYNIAPDSKHQGIMKSTMKAIQVLAKGGPMRLVEVPVPITIYMSAFSKYARTDRECGVPSTSGRK